MRQNFEENDMINILTQKWKDRKLLWDNTEIYSRCRADWKEKPFNKLDLISIEK